MYKKLKYFILIAILLFPFSTFAEGQCSIANGPDKELLNYIGNIKKIISNVTNEIVISPPPLDIVKDYNKVYADVLGLLNNPNDLIGLWNNMISWGGYITTWDYYVKTPIFDTSIPYEIERDNLIIENELDGLSRFLNKAISNGTDAIIIKNACKGVKVNNCNLDNSSVKDILSILLKDMTTLSNTYKSKVLGNNTSGNIILGGPKFNEIWNSYNPEMVNICLKENGVGKTMSDAIKRIEDSNKKSNEGIKLWKEAVDLMFGNSPNYEESEKSILKKELSRQGISSSSKEIIMGNLEKYNQKGLVGSNFIAQSIETINDNLGKNYNNFKKDVFDSFQSKDKKVNKQELTKSIKTIIDLGQKNDITINIVNRISKTYQSEAIFSITEDINTQKLQGKLFNMHSNILDAINKLNVLIPFSEKICNAQDNGNGLCTTK